MSRAVCLDCNDVVDSNFRHDFKSCTCFKKSKGKTGIFLDGGNDYLRFSGNIKILEGIKKRRIEKMKISLVLVSLLALTQTGCMAKYEKVGRMAAAGIVDQIMIENKAALVLQGCAEIDSKYDELRGKIKEQILK